MGYLYLAAELVLNENETLDIICNDRLKMIQRRDCYRFSIDAILISNFITLKRGERLLDIGCGSGVIPLYLTVIRGFVDNQMVGIEIQEGLHQLSARNVIMNGCSNIEIIKGDVRSFLGHAKDADFQVIVSNPPYTKSKTGRPSPSVSRLIARSELSLDLSSLFVYAFKGLKRRGRLYLIYPARRFSELVSIGEKEGFELKRARFVYPREGERASHVLTEFYKEGGREVIIEKPLFIYHNDRYTEEIQSYYL